MRVIYIDTGLIDKTGHHYNISKSILRELKSRGIEALLFANLKVDVELQRELGATPLFHFTPYGHSDGDPICGWLNAFDVGSRAAFSDLSKLPRVTADDIVFIGTVNPPMLLGVAQWIGSMAPGDRPHVVMELGTDCGLDQAPGIDQPVTTRDPRVDPRAAFYRFSARYIPKNAKDRFRLFYVDAHHAELFSDLLDYPVGTLPFYQTASGPLKNRSGRRPVVISVLGHQQTSKGYQLMPDIISNVLRQNGDCQFRIHNSRPAQMAETQATIHEIASREPKVTIDERAVSLETWAGLLSEADLLLCPYSPNFYSIAPSGLACEAIANAIPLIGPAGTTLDRLIREYAGCGVVFDGFDSNAVVKAILTALVDYDRYADLAYAAAVKWAGVNGPSFVVDRILNAAR